MNKDQLIKAFKSPFPLGDEEYTCIQTNEQNKVVLYWKPEKLGGPQRKTKLEIESTTVIDDTLITVFSTLGGEIYTLFSKIIKGQPYANAPKKLVRFIYNGSVF